MKICGCKEQATCKYLAMSKLDSCPLVGQLVTGSCVDCRDAIEEGEIDLDLGPANLGTEIETNDHPIHSSFQKVNENESRTD